MPKHTRSPLRIIWAVDAHERDERVPSAPLWSCRVLARQATAEIEPVYILSLGRAAGGMTYGVPRAQPALSRTEAALRKLLGGVRDRALLAPRIVTTIGDSSKDGARALARHARSEKAALVVVGSHARRGVERLFMGSFSESMMLWTPSPLLVVNPRARVVPAFRRVLFPTDFSEPSRKAFRELLRLARRLKAKVEVLHVLQRPFVETGIYVMGAEENLPVESERARREALKRVEALAAQARRAGVPATATVRPVQDDSISGTIIAAAKRSGAQMVAMSAHSPAWRAVLIGSVARQVVRGADCPVMILRR